MTAPIGPFGSEREASALPQVRAVYEAFDADPGAGKMAPHNRRLLNRALEAAGVAMGDYDDRIAGWLAGWEPHVLAVVAGWISRAHAAGAATATAGATLDGNQLATVLQALGDAITDCKDRAGRACPDCEAHMTGLCDDHAADLDAADRYRALERDLIDQGAADGRVTS